MLPTTRKLNKTSSLLFARSMQYALPLLFWYTSRSHPRLHRRRYRRRRRRCFQEDLQELPKAWQNIQAYFSIFLYPTGVSGRKASRIAAKLIVRFSSRYPDVLPEVLKIENIKGLSELETRELNKEIKKQVRACYTHTRGRPPAVLPCMNCWLRHKVADGRRSMVVVLDLCRRRHYLGHQ